MLDCRNILSAMRFGSGTAALLLALLASGSASAGEPIRFSSPKAEIDSPAKAREKEVVERLHLQQSRASDLSVPSESPDFPVQLPPANPVQRSKDRKNWLMEDKNEQLDRLSGRGATASASGESDPWRTRDATVERVFGVHTDEFSVMGGQTRWAAESSTEPSTTGRADKPRQDSSADRSSVDRIGSGRSLGGQDLQRSRSGSFPGFLGLEREAGDTRLADPRGTDPRRTSTLGSSSSSLFDSNRNLGSQRLPVPAQDSPSIAGTRESSAAKAAGADTLGTASRFDPLAQALHGSSLDELNKRINLTPPPTPSALTNTGDQIRSWHSLSRPNFIEFPKPRL